MSIAERNVDNRLFKPEFHKKNCTMKTESLHKIIVRTVKTIFLPKLYIDTGQMFTVSSIHQSEWKEDLQRFKISKLFLQFISSEEEGSTAVVFFVLF